MSVVERQKMGTLAGLNVFPLNGWPAKDGCFVNRVLLALVAFFCRGFRTRTITGTKQASYHNLEFGMVPKRLCA
jgi:hypothetical protein